MHHIGRRHVLATQGVLLAGLLMFVWPCPGRTVETWLLFVARGLSGGMFQATCAPAHILRHTTVGLPPLHTSHPLSPALTTDCPVHATCEVCPSSIVLVSHRPPGRRRLDRHLHFRALPQRSAGHRDRNLLGLRAHRRDGHSLRRAAARQAVVAAGLRQLRAGCGAGLVGGAQNPVRDPPAVNPTPCCTKLLSFRGMC